MSVNKVILVGNVGRDPEMRYFDNDVAKASFSLATSERGYTTSSGTQVPERTEWHNIVCWRGLAQIAERFVKKGTLLYIEGKIRSRSYDDQNGVKRYITEIVADNLELLGRRVQENDTGGSTGMIETNDPVDNMDDASSEVDDLPF
ncbi:MAG: single-stranded DNA-binding protein [Bacteroidota bacterium]|jgi:single-strand DNA-binding protein|nr:single-stranded DNA-binding protein [Bacteroidota bacterium]